MERVKATLVPLKGKYYTTEIEVTYLDKHGSERKDTIDVYVRGDGNPSERELGDDAAAYTDWHYETEASHEIAELIVNAINTRYGE